MSKIEIKVPTMGESISEATVGQILKKSGSFVHMDDEIIELETDKVNQVLYAPQTGKIEIHVNTDDVVKIGQIIGFIETAKASDNETIKTPEKESKKREIVSPQVVNQEGARVTKENYIHEIKDPSILQDQAKTEKTKPQVIENSISSESLNELHETRKKMSRLRQVISKRLVEVQKETAMLTTFNEVDLSAVIEMRKKYQDSFMKDHNIKLGFMSFFVKASVSALKAFPEVNAYIDGLDIVYRHTYNISIAVSTEKGLVVPVVKNCERRSFANIEKEIDNLAKKARNGSLSIEDLQGGSFTITNGGIYGSLLSTPILNPPQSGILGMHTIQKRAVVIDDQIVIRPMMYLALSYDHRIVDGKEAVSFLIHIKNILEDPARLLLE